MSDTVRIGPVYFCGPCVQGDHDDCIDNVPYVDGEGIPPALCDCECGDPVPLEGGKS